MKYNARGARTSKIKETPSLNGINLETTNYTYDSEGRLRRETRNAFERIYLYSSDGIIGYEEDGEKFLYRKNLFGDITAIYQGLVKVAEYSYDAWGNCTITYDPDGYGASNPIRYRGYYWDSDLGMYYLMTRYYDPKIGRFINADSFEYLEPQKINGLNLYAYCGNNPIMYVDSSGHSVLMSLGIFGFFVTAIMGVALVLASPVIIIVDIVTKISDAIAKAKTKTKPKDKYIDEEVGSAILESAPDIAQGIYRAVFPSNVPGSVGGAGGGSPWDPVLEAIFNESFTGSFE